MTATQTSVALAWVHGNTISNSWHRSLMDLLMYDADHQGSVLRGGYSAVRYGTGGLVAARNTAVENFLKTDTEWLMWLDTDMGFEPDIVDRLLEVADPEARPIVGALCFAQRETGPDGMNGMRTQAQPTIYQYGETKTGAKGFAGLRHYPINAVVRCAGTGSAAILIHRVALAAIGKAWYDRILNPVDHSLLGEDLSFCARAGSAGIPVHVHTGVRTTHHKEVWVGEMDFWRNTFVPPPATEGTAVIVPVKGRPQNAAPFMQSLRASTGLADVYAVMGKDDEKCVRAWDAEGAITLPHDGPTSFAAQVNYGARSVGQAYPWLFIVGDDVRFHSGWLDHAQFVANEYGAQVVGTNDLGSPRVQSGNHATHMLISREYVQQVGASWDGPGVVAHEGYGHWYVDDEIVWAARQRGVWGAALGSIVEHLHPIFGKGEDDEVYRLGMESQEADRKLFAERSANAIITVTDAP